MREDDMLKRMVYLVVLLLMSSWLHAQPDTPRRTIVIGGDFNFPPYEYLDENDDPVGYNCDLTKAIAKEMGYDVVIKLGKWSRVIQWLKDGEIDMIQGMAFSPDRAEMFQFTTPHSQTWRAIFVRRNSPIKTPADIHDAQVAVQQGDIASGYLKQIDFKGSKIEVPSQEDALRLLAMGKYDAAIVNYLNGIYMLDKLGLTGLRVLPERIFARDYCYASLDRSLINDFNTGIGVMRTTGKLDELHNRWFDRLSPDNIARQKLISRLKWTFIPLGSLLLIGVIVAIYLRRKMKLKALVYEQISLERAKIEEELKREYRLFFTGPVTVYKLLYPNNTILSISDNVNQYGHDAKILIDNGTSMFDLILSEDRGEVIEKHRNNIKQRIEYSFHTNRFLGKDETIHWLYDFTMYSYEPTGDILLYGYLLDISSQKNLETELIEEKEKAENANIAKGHFLANMSHEIRTPLNGIMGFVQVLLQSEPTPVQKEYLDMMYSSGTNLMKIVNDILDFSKIESGKLDLIKSGFNLRYVVDDLVKTFSYHREKPGVDIRTRMSDSVPTIVYGDMMRLKQILINLIQNALKFTEEGWVEIAVDVYTQLENDIRLIFCVSDTGIGIDPMKQHDIFDNFTQSDPFISQKYGGTGLGLSIVKKIVEIMGGFIWVESEPNSGSSFFFIIPFEIIQQKQEQIHLPQETLELPDDTMPSLKVLLVEDDPVNQIVTKKQLEHWKHSVSIANHGKEALEKLQVEYFDCILMDIQMPVMDGITTTKCIREQEKTSGKHIKIIAFTAAAMVGDKERFLDAGMDDYLAKPIDVNALLGMLRKC